MSRCFPFPPPGYDKAARPDDENLLTKEKKHKKDRKDKKDKKDRERREGKGKKDRERSEEKQREKKDRKDKLKDQADRHRDKEKKRTSDEKNTVRPPECRNGEKLGPSCTQSNETNEFKFLLELGKRIRNDDSAMENFTVQKITLTGQRNTELPGKVVESNTGNLGKGNENIEDRREDGGKVYGRSNKVEAMGMENGSFQNCIGGNQRKTEGVAGLVDKYAEKRMEEKEKNKHKNSDGRGDRRKDRDREKKSKSKNKKREKDKEKEEKVKDKEPNKEQLKPRESSKNAVDIHFIRPSYLLKGSEGYVDKQKELENNGLLHDDHGRPNKLPRLISSSDQVVENGRKSQPLRTATQLVCESEGTVINHKVIDKVSSSAPVVEIGRKSEPCQVATQFASDWQGTGNNRKVHNKEVSFSHPVLENGRKLEPCHTATHSAFGRQGVNSSHKVDNKDHRINGLIETQQPNVCLTRPSHTPAQIKKNGEVSVKPPHPDSKYLTQILSVPKVEWSDFDEQEWLFVSNDLQAKKLKLGCSQDGGTKQVWAEALRVESADVTALPYVIPY